MTWEPSSYVNGVLYTYLIDEVCQGRTPLAFAFKRAEQLRAAFENTLVPQAEQTLHATLSGGVAAFPDNGLNADDLLRAADTALYAAKAAGRNRVLVS